LLNPIRHYRKPLFGKGNVLNDKISLDLAFDFVNQYSQILPNEQFILLTLIKLLGPNYHGQIHMGAINVAKLTGFDRRTIQRHIAKLKLRNIILIENTYVGDGNYSAPNKYTVIGWSQWVESHA